MYYYYIINHSDYSEEDRELEKFWAGLLQNIICALETIFIIVLSTFFSKEYLLQLFLFERTAIS